MEGDVEAFGKETAFELAGIRQSLANLRTFPALKHRETEGLLTLHGLHFAIGSGAILELDEDADAFVPLPEHV
jgi:carbonic anhydrase